MAAETCCFRPKEQQLYMLELLVDRLNLTPEKIQEIGSAPLCVRLDFLDFPTFEISEEEFWSTKQRQEKQNALSSERKSNDGSLDFSAGKSCLFPKKPNELVEAMQSQPLKLGVYKVAPKNAYGIQKPETAVCTSEIPLSGCLCDQVAMAANDESHIPKPYTLRNTWNLIDERETPSGTILLFLRLTCLGKSVVTKFAFQEKSFLFKSSDSPNEFQCSRIPLDDEEAAAEAEEARDEICVPEGYVKPELDSLPKPRSVIGLAPICQELAKRDGGPLEVVPPLQLSTHRMVEDNAASRIRGPEVTCPQAGRLRCNMRSTTATEFPCGKDICSGGICAGPRSDPFKAKSCCPEQDGNSEWMPNYAHNSRMRGGGRWDENCQKVAAQVPVQSLETLISGACKSSKNEAGSKPGCCCYGKLGTGIATNSGNLGSNKPCQGVDCLIRSFKETQAFVDSIGRVPGLAGLGLMDPAESPFFGRERDDAATSCAEKRGAIVGKTFSSVHHLGRRSHQMPKRPADGKPISTILPAPGAGHTTPGHREAFHADTISQASGRAKKKTEEKSEKHKELQESVNHQAAIVGESGPCGTPRCKSRRKKPRDENQTDESATSSQAAARKSPMGNRSLNLRRTRLRGKSKSYANLAVSRPGGQRNSYVRVSRRIMRLVNAVRDPRFHHGHKNCLDVRLRVPGNMGWLWNTSDVGCKLKTSIGWKPGAISKFVWDRMQEAKAACAGSADGESRPATAAKGRRGKAVRSARSFQSAATRSPWARGKQHEDDRKVELPPTLHIHRKDGTYYVTMHPTNAESANRPELQEAVKPLQFMVTKNRDDGSASSSSMASDMEIEFSPPAAINRYRKSEPRVDRETQVNQQEIEETFRASGEAQQSKKPKKAKIKK